MRLKKEEFQRRANTISPLVQELVERVFPCPEDSMEFLLAFTGHCAAANTSIEEVELAKEVIADRIVKYFNSKWKMMEEAGECQHLEEPDKNAAST